MKVTGLVVVSFLLGCLTAMSPPVLKWADSFRQTSQQTIDANYIAAFQEVLDKTE